MPRASPKPAYPAIVACMNEARAPDRAEIEIVAARVWAEVHTAEAAQWAMLAPTSSARNGALRVALAALGVRGHGVTERIDRIAGQGPPPGDGRAR